MKNYKIKTIFFSKIIQSQNIILLKQENNIGENKNGKEKNIKGSKTPRNLMKLNFCS